MCSNELAPLVPAERRLGACSNSTIRMRSTSSISPAAYKRCRTAPWQSSITCNLSTRSSQSVVDGSDPSAEAACLQEEDGRCDDLANRPLLRLVDESIPRPGRCQASQSARPQAIQNRHASSTMATSGLMRSCGESTCCLRYKGVLTRRRFRTPCGRCWRGSQSNRHGRFRPTAQSARSAPRRHRRFP